MSYQSYYGKPVLPQSGIFETESCTGSQKIVHSNLELGLIWTCKPRLCCVLCYISIIENFAQGLVLHKIKGLGRKQLNFVKVQSYRRASGQCAFNAGWILDFSPLPGFFTTFEMVM